MKTDGLSINLATVRLTSSDPAVLAKARADLARLAEQSAFRQSFAARSDQ